MKCVKSAHDRKIEIDKTVRRLLRDLNRSKKMIIFILFIVVYLLLNYYLFKYEYKSLNKTALNDVDIFLASVLFLTFCIVALDIKNILSKKRAIGQLLFKIYSPMYKIQIFTILLLVFVAGGNILFYIKTHSTNQIFGNLALILLALQFSFHTFSRSGINETGIVYQGNYYKWDSIDSYELNNHAKTILLKKINRFFCFKFTSNLKCNIKPEQKDDINDLLEKYISKKY